jgi:hypothetical protein
MREDGGLEFGVGRRLGELNGNEYCSLPKWNGLRLIFPCSHE